MAWNCMRMGCAARRLAVPFASLVLTAAMYGAGSGTAANPAAPIALAAGHPARLHLRAEATRVRDGQTEIETLDMAGTRRLARSCADDLCHGTWFDGSATARFGLNGTPFPDRADDDGRERTFAAIVSTAFAEPEFIATGGSVDELPEQDGERRYLVRAAQGEALVALADGRTRRLTAVAWPDGRSLCALYGTTSGTFTLYAPRRYDRVELLDTSLEAPKAPAVTVVAAPDLPLLSTELPIVPCALGGRIARCLIDTGTSPSAVTLGFAERLGQEPHGTIEIAGLHPYLTGVIDAGPLTFGGAVVDRLRFAVVPRAVTSPFDIILGSDVLEGVRLVLDGARDRVQVGSTQAESTGRPIAVDFADGVPYAQVRLGNRDRTQPMLMDTGDSGLLAIGYDEYREDLGLFAAQAAELATSVGGSPMDVVAGRLDHAEVGGEALRDAPIRAVRGQHIGHVGYRFALHCGRFVLDLRARRIECGTREATRAQPDAGEQKMSLLGYPDAHSQENARPATHETELCKPVYSSATPMPLEPESA